MSITKFNKKYVVRVKFNKTYDIGVKKFKFTDAKIIDIPSNICDLINLEHLKVSVSKFENQILKKNIYKWVSRFVD